MAAQQAPSVGSIPAELSASSDRRRKRRRNFSCWEGKAGRGSADSFLQLRPDLGSGKALIRGKGPPLPLAGSGPFFSMRVVFFEEEEEDDDLGLARMARA